MIGLLVEFDVADGKRPERLAMVAVLQGDEPGLARPILVKPGMETHFQSGFHCRGAIVRIKAAIQAGRCYLNEPFRQCGDGFVREACQQHMFKCFQLPDQCRVDAGVAVAEQIDPPGTDGIQVAPAFEVFQPDALAGAYRYKREPLVVLHLRAWMPQDGQITFYQVGV